MEKSTQIEKTDTNTMPTFTRPDPTIGAVLFTPRGTVLLFNQRRLISIMTSVRGKCPFWRHLQHIYQEIYDTGLESPPSQHAHLTPMISATSFPSCSWFLAGCSRRGGCTCRGKITSQISHSFPFFECRNKSGDTSEHTGGSACRNRLSQRIRLVTFRPDVCWLLAPSFKEGSRSKRLCSDVAVRETNIGHKCLSEAFHVVGVANPISDHYPAGRLQALTMIIIIIIITLECDASMCYSPLFSNWHLAVCRISQD